MGTVPFSLAAMIVGALTPFAFAVAIFSDGNWFFDENMLSDLGVSSDDFARNLFMATCIIGGVCTAIFGFGKLMIKHKLDAASGFFLVIAGIFLIAVGLFDKTTTVHSISAPMYFFMMLISMCISLFADSGNKRYLTMSVTVIALFMCFAAMPGFTIAGVEVISVCAICLWMFVQGLSLSFSNDYNAESDNRMVSE
jgi:hypothetical membrane protein